MYKDAMETVSESEDKDLAEEILRFFVENGHHECFCACLYTCYDLMRPDVTLELAWRNKIFDFAMPYLIQQFKEFTEKILDLTERMEKKEEATSQGGIAPAVDMGMGMGAMVPVNPGYGMMPAGVMPPSGYGGYGGGYGGGGGGW